MSEERASLQRLLAALARRERWLLLARGLVQAAAGLGAVLLVAVALAAARLPWPAGLVLLVICAVLLPLLALLVPALPGWRSAGDLVRQARLVEALRPELRGRLITLAERPEGPQPGESASLLELAARRAQRLLDDVEPRRIHSPQPVGRAALGLLVVLAACALTGALGPTSPAQALRLLVREPVVAEQATTPLPGPEPEHAVLGDIVLRYHYPDYTRLEPLEVPNSTGDVHAPPGTRVEVRARTARPWQGAKLVLERDRTSWAEASTHRDAVRLEGGRNLLASFELTAPGRWLFELEGASGVLLTRSHVVALDEDLAPEVLLMGGEGKVLEVAWDQPLPVSWTARDDYGLASVSAEAQGAPGARTHTLRQPLDTALRLEGAGDFTPADLGLMPGVEARVRIVAWDNDAVSGTKAGHSAPVRVRVLGPRGQNDRRRRVVRKLRDAMLAVLAGHLEDSWPPSSQRTELRSWGASAARRMDPVEQLVEDAWAGYQPEGFEGAVIEQVRRSQASALGFVQALGSEGPPVADADLDTLSGLRDELVSDLEQGILTLDEVVQALALGKLSQHVAALREDADGLEALSDSDAGRVYTRLDRLERHLQRIEDAAEELGDSRLAHFTHHRVRDVTQLSNAVRSAHGAKKEEAARVYQARLVRELWAFAEQFQQLRERQREMEMEAARRVAELRDEIEALHGEESALLGELLRAIQRQGDPAQALASRWEAQAQRAQALSESLGDLGQRMMEHEGRPASEWRLALQASAEVERLAQALEARDLGRSLEGVAEAEWSLQRLQDTVQRHAAHAELLDRAMPDQAGVERELGQAVRAGTQLRQDLESLLHHLAAEPARLVAGTAPLAPNQEALQQRTEAAGEEAAELLRDMPMKGTAVIEGLQRADGEMQRAGDALPRGQAQDAEGSQRAAIQALAEALRALEEAMQSAQDMNQMKECENCKGGGGQAGKQGGREQDGQPRSDRARVEIPAPEEFRTPEAYRKALLEGMQGAVPDEYEALKRRYYEDLVRQ